MVKDVIGEVGLRYTVVGIHFGAQRYVALAVAVREAKEERLGLDCAVRHRDDIDGSIGVEGCQRDGIAMAIGGGEDSRCVGGGAVGRREYMEPDKSSLVGNQADAVVQVLNALRDFDNRGNDVGRLSRHYPRKEHERCDCGQ